MKSLQERSYYEDRYDHMVVDVCRMDEDILKELWKKLYSKTDPTQRPGAEKALWMMAYLRLFLRTWGLAERRNDTIMEWMNDDRRHDEFFERTTPPSKSCTDCGKPMTLVDKILDTGFDNNPDRIVFSFKCPRCDRKKHVYDNGEEYATKPTICPKCGSKNIIHWSSTSDEYLIFIDTCKDCGDVQEDKIDRSTKEKEDPKFEEDKARFCLTQEGLEKYWEWKRNLDNLSAFVKEQEERKKKEHIYEAVKKLQKLDIVWLKKLLVSKMDNSAYNTPEVNNPVIGASLTVDLTLFTEKPNQKDFQKFMMTTLDGTNWTIVKNSIVDKLWVIQCKLQGFEVEADLVKLVEQRLK